ncbi:MAG: LysM peptidoglycan-binding domain-containing protein, partial [Anaerolineales bacterium]|nr:LysM peptidoglycan-binding domain-containing protein [Anaerolineales bacterium]
MSKRLFQIFFVPLFISSCFTSTGDAYPTYDPFAPVDVTNAVPEIVPGQVFDTAVTPRGPTPTRAPVSVTLPAGNSNIGLTTPTPDPPHPLPPPREFVDQYIVQPGDTLGIVSQRYGISLSALMEANGLNEFSILSVGQVLDIPPVVTDPTPGSSFKIIPNSELVFGPASVEFDLEAYLGNKNGYLSNYVQEVDGEFLSGSQIVMRVARNYSVNPRLLVALIEYRSGWVTNPVPANIDYPLGYINDFYA